jgi:hypothetical protein
MSGREEPRFAALFFSEFLEIAFAFGSQLWSSFFLGHRNLYIRHPLHPFPQSSKDAIFKQIEDVLPLKTSTERRVALKAF